MNFQLIVHDPRIINNWGGLKPATPGSAAYDLFAAIDSPIHIRPGETVLIDTGISLWMRDPNYVALIYPRSGLGVKRGLVLANGTGVIDSDYQGRWQVALLNRQRMVGMDLANEETIFPGDRIAQFIFQRIEHPTILPVTAFSEKSERGTDGVGSTGTSYMKAA